MIKSAPNCLNDQNFLEFKLNMRSSKLAILIHPKPESPKSLSQDKERNTHVTYMVAGTRSIRPGLVQPKK